MLANHHRLGLLNYEDGEYYIGTWKLDKKDGIGVGNSSINHSRYYRLGSNGVNTPNTFKVAEAAKTQHYTRRAQTSTWPRALSFAGEDAGLVDSGGCHSAETAVSCTAVRTQGNRDPCRPNLCED